MRTKSHSTTTRSPRVAGKSNRGYYDRSIPKKKPGEGRTLKLAEKVAVLLIKGTISARDGARVREEMCRTLMKQFGFERARAQSVIDLAKEIIQFRCYGRYRRTPLEMNLLLARAAGTVGEVASN